MPQYRIHPDLSAQALADKWVNGNKTEVIDTLANEHPGLTALFLDIMAKNRHVGVGGWNSIVNQLIDRRQDATKEQDKADQN